MSENESKWVVLHCHSDDSHVLIPASDVICLEDDAKVGEKVSFHYPGIKELLTGTVKAFSEDFQAMKKAQDRLNRDTKPKRQKSFHEGEKRLRNSVVRAQSAKEPQSKKSKTTKLQNSGGSCETQGKQSSILGKVLDSNLSSSSEEEAITPKAHSSNAKAQASSSKLIAEGPWNDVASSSASELDEAEAALLEKLKKKMKNRDFTALLCLAETNRKGQSTVQGGTEPSDVGLTKQNSFIGNGSKQSHQSKVVNVQSDSVFRSSKESERKSNKESHLNWMGDDLNRGGSPELNDVSDDGKEVATHSMEASNDASTKKLKRGSNPSRPPVTKIAFDGEFYRWKESDDKVERVSADYDVFALASDIKEVKKRWNTATATARALARQIFTKSALRTCSVSGKPRVNRDGVPEMRTALPKDGVNAIIKFVFRRCDKKNWKKPAEPYIRMSLNNLMYEMRSAGVLPDDSD